MLLFNMNQTKGKDLMKDWHPEIQMSPITTEQFQE